MATYLSSAARDQLEQAQAQLDEHLVTGPDGRCLACRQDAPCSRRDEMSAVFARYGMLPVRVPGLARIRPGQQQGIAARASRRPLPALSAGDIVLTGIATHKLSRILTKDSVATPLRAPFTRYKEPAGNGEINEEVRGEGVQHAIGELVSCPFCIAVWVATGLTAGMVFAPRLTRLIATTFTAVAASDFLQLGYATAEKAAERD